MASIAGSFRKRAGTGETASFCSGGPVAELASFCSAQVGSFRSPRERVASPGRFGSIVNA